MRIKTDLLKNYIFEVVVNNIEDFEINADSIANTVAIKALAEIQKVITNDTYSDFEQVEEIVRIFEKYNIDFGNCHDFG